MTPDTSCIASELVRTLRLKVRKEAYRWLDAAAEEVNVVFNYCNETSFLACTRSDKKRKWLSGYDLCALTSGAKFPHIKSGTVQRICTLYARRRQLARRKVLRWRVSRGPRRSLGWIPFKAISLQRKGKALRFCGKTFRVFDARRLERIRWMGGCFSQDAVGDWWLCVPFKTVVALGPPTCTPVGIDLGIKQAAVTSEGERLAGLRFFRDAAERIGELQRRGHLRQAKRLYRKTRRRREDACHKFSKRIVDRYCTIYIGSVSSQTLSKTHLAAAALDNGWGIIKRMLRYKGEYAGRSVHVVNERNTTRVCSNCGAYTGPRGLRQLAVRTWECSQCFVRHDRDVNAARNILMAGFRC